MLTQNRPVWPCFVQSVCSCACVEFLLVPRSASSSTMLSSGDTVRSLISWSVIILGLTVLVVSVSRVGWCVHLKERGVTASEERGSVSLTPTSFVTYSLDLRHLRSRTHSPRPHRWASPFSPAGPQAGAGSREGIFPVTAALAPVQWAPQFTSYCLSVFKVNP